MDTLTTLKEKRAMFKFIAIAFALSLSLLTGCTGGDEKDSASTDSAVVAE